jgi:hypothetical protein
MGAPLSRKALLLAGGLVLAAAGPARASVPEIRMESGAAPVELLEPRPGAVLPGGGIAVLAWEPRDGLDLEALGFREWEAFLSLDGGGRYPVRLTPHLDLELQRFGFQVPAVAAEDVRLLLRFGDEETEVGYELPLRFQIAAPVTPPVSGGLPVLAPGEAARPGEPGVVQWVEGSRRGRGLRHRTALPSSSRATPLRWSTFPSRPGCLAPRPVELVPDGAPASTRAGDEGSSRPRTAALDPPPTDLLLTTGRRNE